MRTTFGIIRVLGFAAIIAAIIGQGINTAIFFGAQGKGDNAVGHSLVNFFSFFTIESNIIAAATFGIGAGVLLLTKGDGPAWFATLRLGAVTYMTITGLVYNLLLRGYPLPQGRTLEWANEVFHVVMPIIVVLDFLLAPGRVRLDFKKIWLITPPVAWCAPAGGRRRPGVGTARGPVNRSGPAAVPQRLCLRCVLHHRHRARHLPNAPRRLSPASTWAPRRRRSPQSSGLPPPTQREDDQHGNHRRDHPG